MPVAGPNASYDSSVFLKACIPLLPVQSWDALSIFSNSASAGILILNEQHHLYSGRYALSMALNLAQIGYGDCILLPAYHCLAMVEPLRLAGVTPIYYPINSNLSVDLNEIMKRSKNVKAIIVVHFFGFPQDFKPIRNLADQLGLILIEDCAHACLGENTGIPLGAIGDYVIASTMKFFPIGHGGVLASARHPLTNLELRDPPLKEEFKTAFNLLEEAQSYDRLGRLGQFLTILIKIISGFRQRWFKYRRQILTPNSAGSTQNKIPEYAIDQRWLGWRASRVSRFLLRHTNIKNLIEYRRRNYQTLLNAVEHRSDCHPLFPILPDGVVPQVFPLYVNRCLPVFVTLKRQGVPIIRFGEFLDEAVDHTVCPISVDYSEHVLQFPCHQSLRENELKWIIDRLIYALDAVES